MKVHLLYRDQDFNLAQAPGPHDAALVQDLGLETLFAAMSQGDKWLSGIAEKVLLTPSSDLGTINYRQGILKDCLANETAVRRFYDLAVEAIEAEKKEFSWGLRHPKSILRRSLTVLHMFVGMLQRLRAMAEEQAGAFRSEGFRTLLTMLRSELDDEYLATVRRHLKQLRLEHGVLISARLGTGNMGVNHVLRRENPPRGDLLTRLFEPKAASYSWRLADRDESGARALSELKDRGLNLIANALAQSADHILSFFKMLRLDLAFYVGCLNLHRQLVTRGVAVCTPEAAEAGDRKQTAAGLYDVCLALTSNGEIIGNPLMADDADLVIITGANQGGKTTFLRGFGLAQLMMQNGMFVAAETFQASVCEGIFTHFKREEDAGMSSGRLDEELSRMSDIIDHVTPYCLLLFNESFSSTNEGEGSEIARQIVTALTEHRVRVCFVTHQYELAHAFQSVLRPKVLFLRAERAADGARTFRITEGEALRTSHGEDLYGKIFQDEGAVFQT